MSQLTLHTSPYSENPYAWDVPDESGDFATEAHDELGRLSTVFLINDIVTSTVGGVLSCLLLYLVLYRTTGPLKQYRQMLLICCLTDTVYWLVDNSMWMKLKQKDGVFMLKMEGIGGLMRWPYRVFLVAFYVWVLCFVNVILPVQLYFRYYSLVKNRILSGTRTIGLCAVAALVTFPVFACTYLSFGWSSKEQPGFNYGTLWFKEFPMPQLLFGDARSPYQKGFLYIGGGVITASYVLVMFIGYRTLQRIRNMNDSYSEKTRRLQRQLTNFMIVQAVIPMFTSVLPVMVIVSPSLYYTEDDRLCLYSVILISWIPVINPIITIVVIVPFRRIVFRAVTSKISTVHTLSDTSTIRHQSAPENMII
ncbi:unnamed protein product [Bursaphelenchus xylophilus]|uniref:(pine wood nematode) hypothetical protein n=1 Tax=Bursaphelenchus xylophilus TaxID=6326 RepID=A0A1I7RJW6_BURXY|nr:unnamed protein product [Bursaphelenchus xylophilus]CAG9129117.1 unnamed protein product [Bursaphelenchus xylophilus]